MTLTAPHELRTDFATYALDARGILVVRIISAETNSLERAKQGIERLRQLAGTARYPLLIDVTKGRDLEPAARHYYVESAPTYATRVAVVTRSLVATVAGNFFVAVMSGGKNALPSRIFRDEAEAVRWLLMDV
jgi:hypothetical protein